jgi:glycoprotein 6-alpha-L-fucosyltransferase
MPIIDSIHPRPPFLAQTIPSSIADRLIRLHGHPYVWWLGQLLMYIVRPQPSLTEHIKQATKRLGFHGPIVGLVQDVEGNHIQHFES